MPAMIADSTASFSYHGKPNAEYEFQLMHQMRHRLRAYLWFGVSMGGESPSLEFCSNERRPYARQVP